MRFNHLPDIVRTAAGLPAAVFLSATLAGVGSTTADQAEAVCRVTPKILDVRRPAGQLTVRIELHASSGGAASTVAASIENGVYVASVNRVRLPAPSAVAEGIEERAAARRVEDRSDLRRRAPHPNGIPELVVLFDRPADGDPATRGDGDAGDVLAMLMDVPDGRSVPVCIAGRVDGAPFECCDTITVRNRGLRDLPRSLVPQTER